MMRTLGVYLLYAAIALRGIVVFASNSRLPLVIALFAAYGLLLVLEPRFIGREENGISQTVEQEDSFKQKWRSLLYICALSALVIGLMAVPEPQDFFALLFVPLSMQVVLSFGRRLGYACIAVFTLIIIAALLGSEDGPLFGMAMGAFFGGMLFLFGGYAYQVQQAEIARNQNQRMIDELQTAHRQLQNYADQVAAMSVEQERSRLAHDLHDSVTQTAFSMNLAAQSVQLLLTKEPLRVREQLIRLEKLAANALGEIQTLVSQLRPRSVAEEGLPAALRRLVSERQEEGLEVSLRINGDRVLSEAEVLGLYSVANEALTNVVKHSGVHEAAIRLNLGASGSCLEVEDRGVGFDPQTALNKPGHLGMSGIRERVGEIGWSLTITAHPGQGTCIQVTEKQTECPE